MKTLLLSALCLALAAGAGAQDCPEIRLGQGIMAGRVTETSAILQARLTDGDRLRGHDLAGCKGWARWEVIRWPGMNARIPAPWLRAEAERDYIVKDLVTGLAPGTRYGYRLWYGADSLRAAAGEWGTFRTLGGADEAREVRLVVVTGMNYDRFYRDPDLRYHGADSALGYPALETILGMEPDYFIGTGDNVYYDASYQPLGMATDREGIRRCYHEQFARPRFRELFRSVPTYWEKDDHDYRYNDCDNTGDRLPLPRLGREMFLEQLPVSPDSITYGTYRMSRDLQIWLVEGRDYRSPNAMPDGPGKTIWGGTQREWLMRTLKESDATFRVLISPTPMIGPDDAYKRDNHANLRGFQHERDAFFAFLVEEELAHNFFIVCGDRHWQYHSIHPSGLEEFSSGALVDANSRVGRMPGDSLSTDPDAIIRQPYVMQEASGGFLQVRVTPGAEPRIYFEFFDERGVPLYNTSRSSG